MPNISQSTHRTPTTPRSNNRNIFTINFTGTSYEDKGRSRCRRLGSNTNRHRRNARRRHCKGTANISHCRRSFTTHTYPHYALSKIYWTFLACFSLSCDGVGCVSCSVSCRGDQSTCLCHAGDTHSPPCSEPATPRHHIPPLISLTYPPFYQSIALLSSCTPWSLFRQ